MSSLPKTVMTMAALSVLACFSCSAAGVGGGTITYMGGTLPGMVMVGITPVPTGRAVCNNNSSYQFVFDASTPEGKALYSALLMAKATDKRINLQGTGNCPTGYTMELVQYWYFEP